MNILLLLMRNHSANYLAAFLTASQLTKASKILPGKFFNAKCPEETENQVRFFIFYQEKRENRKIQKMKNFKIIFLSLKLVLKHFKGKWDKKRVTTMKNMEKTLKKKIKK